MTMSILHTTRLAWCEARGSGIAAHEGVCVLLRRQPPVLAALGRLVELEYVPAAGIAYYQPQAWPRADLQPEQARECMRYLRGIALAGLTAADTAPPAPIGQGV